MVIRGYNDGRPEPAPILRAAAHGSPEELREAIAEGADPNTRCAQQYEGWAGCPEGSTALHIITTYNPDNCSWDPSQDEVDYHKEKYFRCAEVLIAAGASPLLRNRHGHNAVYLAASFNQPKILKLLLDAGGAARVNDIVGTQGWTALGKAARSEGFSKYKGHAECARLLLCAGADANLRTRSQTPLQHAMSLDVRPHGRRLYPILFRHGAAMPSESELTHAHGYHERGYHAIYSLKRTGPHPHAAYLRKIATMPGGFRAYEREHRRRLTAVFANKFPALPVECISHIVLLWAHLGDY